MDGYSLVNKGNFNTVTCDVLNLLGQQANLSAFLLIGWGHMQGQQQSQGINHPMNLAAFATLVSVETSPRHFQD